MWHSMLSAPIAVCTRTVLLKTTSSSLATSILKHLCCRPATLLARLWLVAILTATAMSAATGPDPLTKQRTIVGHIDTPERSHEPINTAVARTSSGEQASLGTMICCHRRRAGDDIKQTRNPTVSRWERLVRKARRVRRLQRYWGNIG